MLCGFKTNKNQVQLYRSRVDMTCGKKMENGE